MKRIILDFLHRGLITCGFGPMVVAVIFLTLQKNIGLETITINEYAISIFSSAILAFIAGGMNVIYQIERLPLMTAILIHGIVLYVTYLVVYLINNWIVWGVTPILIFTVIFVTGYLFIWLIIYIVNKSRTRKLNEMLKRKQSANVITDKNLFR